MTDEWVPSTHGTERGALQGRVTRGLGWTFLDQWGRLFNEIFGLARAAMPGGRRRRAARPAEADVDGGADEMLPRGAPGGAFDDG